MPSKKKAPKGACVVGRKRYVSTEFQVDFDARRKLECDKTFRYQIGRIVLSEHEKSRKTPLESSIALPLGGLIVAALACAASLTQAWVSYGQQEAEFRKILFTERLNSVVSTATLQLDALSLIESIGDDFETFSKQMNDLLQRMSNNPSSAEQIIEISRDEFRAFSHSWNTKKERIRQVAASMPAIYSKLIILLPRDVVRRPTTTLVALNKNLEDLGDDLNTIFIDIPPEFNLQEKQNTLVRIADALHSFADRMPAHRKALESDFMSLDNFINDARHAMGINSIRR
jgi:hypothetical protein